MSVVSFVGEKEKRTLETLSYSPLSVKQIFTEKEAASFLLSMSVSRISFLTRLAVLETGACLTVGRLIVLSGKWLLAMLLVSPSLSLWLLKKSRRGFQYETLLKP